MKFHKKFSRFFCAAIAAAMLCCGAAAGQDVIVSRRPVIVTAQDHALVLARRGTLAHSSCGQTEGIGYGSTPDEARRNCCYYREAMAGRRVIVEEGIAYSPVTRRWFAVIRYR